MGPAGCTGTIGGTTAAAATAAAGGGTDAAAAAGTAEGGWCTPFPLAPSAEGSFRLSRGMYVPDLFVTTSLSFWNRGGGGDANVLCSARKYTTHNLLIKPLAPGRSSSSSSPLEYLHSSFTRSLHARLAPQELYDRFVQSLLSTDNKSRSPWQTEFSFSSRRTGSPASDGVRSWPCSAPRTPPTPAATRTRTQSRVE